MIKQVGRYEIVATLGRGGFGHVVSAFDPTFSRMVAIKLLTMTADPSVLKRFRNEAIASGRLRHPNIVTVHDSGEQDGTPYIVMELVEGQDLQKVIATRTPLEPWQRIQIIADAASGLAHAHAQGIIHRDIKPANIMMLPDGTVKIMDFGIARMSQSDQTGQTATGALIGTLKYMAPEQFQGREPSARSDIFALGLVAYELWTGVYPFSASETAALLYNVLNVDPVPVRELWSDCPPVLESMLSRMLEKEPDLRYQTLEDALFDIQPALLDLRRAKAVDLLRTAQEARQNQQLSVAQQLVRQVLEMDAALPGARDLREAIQTALRRQAVRPRIEEAVRAGRERMSAGQLQAAVERFESAIRLDPSDEELKGLLSEARSALDLSRRVAEMLAQASKTFRAGDFAEARRQALGVLAVSPTEGEAHRLIGRCDTALEEQRVQALLTAHIGRARQLIADEAWAEAENFLRGAQAELPAAGELRSMAEQVRASKAAAERGQLLARRLAVVRAHFDAGEWEQAFREVDSAAREFPESVEAARLLQQARAELEHQRRELAVQASLAKAGEFAEGENYGEARRTLESGLATYPTEQRLLQEMRRVVAAELEAERRIALAAALAEARKSLDAGLFDRADEVLRDFTSRFGAAQDAYELGAGIAAARQRHLYLLALGEAVRRGQALIGEDRLQEAISELGKFASEPAAAAVIETAERRLREIEQRESAYRSAYDNAVSLCSQGKLDAALVALDTFDRTGEIRPEVGALRTQILTEREHLRAAELNQTVAQASELLQNGKAEEAVALLRACPAYLSGNPEIARLRKAADSRLHEKAVRERAYQQARKSAERLLDKREWTKAVLSLGEYEKAFGDDPRLQPLRARAEDALAAQTEADLEELAGMVSEHIAAGRFPLAEATLGSLAPAHRARPQFAALAGELNRLQEARRIEKAVADCAAEVERLEAKSAWDEALRCIDRALASCPGNATLIDLQARSRQKKEVEHREAARGEFVTRIESHIRDSDWGGATGLLKLALRDFPQDSELTVQWSAVEGNRRQQEEQEREIAEAIAHAERQLPHSPAEGLASLKDLAARYPGRSEISHAIDTAKNAVRQREVGAAVAEVERLAAAGDYEGVLEQVTDWVLKGKEWAPELEPIRLEAARKVLASRLNAAQAPLPEAPDEARRLLLDLQGKYPRAREIADALAHCERIIADRASAALERELAQQLAEAEARMAAVPAQALEMLRALEIRFPARKEIASALRNSEKRIAELAAAAMEQELAQGLAGAEARMVEAPDQAREMLRALQIQFPKRKEVASALRSCEKEIAKRAAAAAPVPHSSGSSIPKPVFAGAALAVAAVAIWAVWPSAPRTAIEQTTAESKAPIEVPRTPVSPKAATNNQPNISPQNTKGSVPKDAPPPIVPPGPQQGQLAIEAGAPNVEVFVDGRSAGRTNAAGSLLATVSASRHSVEIRDPRFNKTIPGVTVASGRATRLTFPQTKLGPKEFIPPTPGRKAGDDPLVAEDLPIAAPNREPSSNPLSISPVKPPAPPVPSPKPPTPVPNNVTDIDAIRDVLADFSTSFSQKNLSRVLNAWPGMPGAQGYRDAFRENSYRVAYSISISSPPQVQGDHAQVLIRRTVVTTLGQARPVPTEANVTVSLQKTGDRWIITDMR